MNQLIAKVKAVTIKSKTSQVKFSAAVLYYVKNFSEVKAIVESFVGSGILATQAKVSLQKSDLAGQLLKLKDLYECLVKLIEKMESVKYTI